MADDVRDLALPLREVAGLGPLLDRIGDAPTVLLRGATSGTGRTCCSARRSTADRSGCGSA